MLSKYKTLLLFFVFAVAAFSLPAIAQSTTSLPTLFLIGDSTVNTPTKDQQGWGDPIASFFDRTKIKVENKARGGRRIRC
jgi:rhamnogalacturonan acetylesterase